jgi:hypothetical protein
MKYSRSPSFLSRQRGVMPCHARAAGAIPGTSISRHTPGPVLSGPTPTT